MVQHGKQAAQSALVPDRNPVETLNYESLLRVCGSPRMHLSTSPTAEGSTPDGCYCSGLTDKTKHVVAEVLVNKRWIVVDPTFHLVFRGADGNFLTRSQLVDPTVFTSATRSVANYDPTYTFERTAHVHMTHIFYLGAVMRRVLNVIAPTWEETTTTTLMFGDNRLPR